MLHSLQMQTTVDKEKREKSFLIHFEFLHLFLTCGEVDKYFSSLFAERETQDVCRVVLLPVESV